MASPSDGPTPPWTLPRATSSASRTIDMWPNCEETRAAEGYPDGTDLFPLGLGDYPMPGAHVLALVGRVGDGPAFHLGRKSTVIMPQSGRLQLSANDPDWRKKDDEGWYRVVIEGPKSKLAIAVR